MVKHVLILGCGCMGTALLQGWLRNGDADIKFTAYTRTSTSSDRLKASIGSGTATGNVTFASGTGLLEASRDADLVLLGFMPRDLDFVLDDTIGLSDVLSQKIVVSMLAGVPTAAIKAAFHAQGATTSLRLARVIPTIAASFGESITLVAGETANAEIPHIKDVRQLFSRVGSCLLVLEKLMDEATAIGAAIHALTIVAVDAATDASVAAGVPRSTALPLIAQSLQSAASLIAKGGMSPESVKAAMSTPSGITINALVHLDAHARRGISTATTGAIDYTRKMK